LSFDLLRLAGEQRPELGAFSRREFRERCGELFQGVAVHISGFADERLSRDRHHSRFVKLDRRLPSDSRLQ
jgi:hypothetical protein